MATDYFPMPLDVAVANVRNAFPPPGMGALQSTLRRTKFRGMQFEFERLADSNGATASPIVLTAYLTACVPATYPNDCLSSMVPRIVEGIADGTYSQVISEFAYCVIRYVWDTWTAKQRSALGEFADSLWCHRIRGPGIGIDDYDLVCSSAFGLRMKEILEWWGGQSDVWPQVLAATMINGGMSELTERRPYWTNREIPEFTEAVASTGRSVTDWLLSPRVEANLEAVWCRGNLDSESGEWVRRALEFLYALRDSARG